MNFQKSVSLRFNKVHAKSLAETFYRTTCIVHCTRRTAHTRHNVRK